jgi:hypothetical protein
MEWAAREGPNGPIGESFENERKTVRIIRTGEQGKGTDLSEGRQYFKMEKPPYGRNQP